MLCVTLVNHHSVNEPHLTYNCISDITFPHPLLSKLVFTSNNVMEGQNDELVNHCRFCMSIIGKVEPNLSYQSQGLPCKCFRVMFLLVDELWMI